MANHTVALSVSEESTIGKAAVRNKQSIETYLHDVGLWCATADNNQHPDPTPTPPTPLTPPNVIPWHASAKVIFSDEFDGDHVDTSKWNIGDNNLLGTGSDGNNEFQRYMTANVEVSNGTLKLTAKKEASTNGLTFTSGMLSSRKESNGPQKFKFGGNGQTSYVETRMRCPKGGGYVPAFWCRGADTTPGWPAYGEFDVVEVETAWNKDAANTYEAAIHYALNGVHKQVGGQEITVDSTCNWHTYGMLWTPAGLQFLCDGVVVQTYVATDADAKKALNYEHTLILNLAVGGDIPTVYHKWDGTWKDGEIPGVMEVDYVRIWQPA